MQAKPNRLLSGVIFPAILCLLYALPVMAQSQWQAHDELFMAAREHIKTHFPAAFEVQINFTRLDKRLHLEKCQQPLQPFLTGNRPYPAGAINIGVRCTSPNWKVRLPARVRAFTRVLVAKRPIAKGSMIADEDLAFARHDIGKYFAGVFLTQPDLSGMVARRSIQQSAVITPRMVKPRRLIRRGDSVSIIATTGGITIRTRGEALMNGHQGQIITVKNTKSGRKISAEVIARSTVRVKM